MFKQFLAASFFALFLLSSCEAQNQISGEWISKGPEKNSSGTYGIRHFRFKKGTWEVQATVYLDSLLRSPVLTFRATGKYAIGKKTPAVKGAWEALFMFDKK
jgi:hypothetical protein